MKEAAKCTQIAALNPIKAEVEAKTKLDVSCGRQRRRVL